jgi:hypothetical protein
VWKRPLSEMTPSPIILSAKDVPDDQGGKLTLYWAASHLDTNTATLPYYSIWRSISPAVGEAPGRQSTSPASSDPDARARRTIRFDGNGYSWEWMANQPAQKTAEYSYAVPTLFDSMSTTDGMQYFLVTAQTHDSDVFYRSNIDSGYSVDNLSPLPPQNFTGDIVGNTFELSWDANQDPDVDHYNLYRSTTSGFDPDTTPPLALVSTTSFVDNLMLPIPTYYYVVRAVDVHGNRSTKSSEVSTALVGVVEESQLPTEYALDQNYPNPFNPLTSVRYALPSTERVYLSVFNILGQEVAVIVNQVQEQGYKTVSVDASNLPSGVYTYRITAGTFTGVRKMMLVK